MILGDFHVHSTFSDGKLSIPELVDLYGSNGFGALAITDHLCEIDTFMGKAAAYLGKTLTKASFPIYQEILRSEKVRAWEKYKMILIPGIELTKNSLIQHRQAHILALGVTEWISAEPEVDKISQAIRHQGGISIAAHPLSPKRMGNQNYFLWDHRHELEDQFDAWEITNTSIILKEVVRTNLPKLATSDLHTAKQFSSWKTLVKSHLHPEAILEGIRKQNIQFQFYQAAPKLSPDRLQSQPELPKKFPLLLPAN